MKAIKIKEELKEQFLQAANHLALKATQLKKMDVPGEVYFKIEGHVSQDEIFRLGYLFCIIIKNNV